MGNAESLSPPISNSKFNKYQASDKFIIVHKSVYSKSNEFTSWSALQSHRQHIYNHPNAYNTQIFKIIEDGFCNQSCQVLYRGQKFENCLFDEINRRKQIGRIYHHQQIWYMMLMLVDLALFVHQNGQRSIIGNVHPKNIFINNEGKVKVITLNSFHSQKDHYQTFKNQGVLSAFISPELIGFTLSKDKAYKQFPQCVSKKISQTFTIGMTLLSMCLLQTNLSNLYDLSFYMHQSRPKMQEYGVQKTQKVRKHSIHYSHSYADLINKKYLDFYIKQIQQRYCNLLGTVIKALINPNPGLRYTLKNLFKQILEPNLGYIMGMELFWLGADNSSIMDQNDSNKQEASSFYYQSESYLN